VSSQTAAPPGRTRPALYWIIIAAVLIGLAVLYLYHLATGVTPSRTAVAFNILGFTLDIYWYGIVIVTGIGLGCWVAADLAGQRARALFEATVPAGVRQRPLSGLKEFPQKTAVSLAGKKMTTLGDLLYVWGLDPRNLGLKKEETAELSEYLAGLPGVKESWLDDAPWAVWNPDHVWNAIIWALIFAVIGARLYHVLTPSPSMAAYGIYSPLDYFRQPSQLLNLRAGGLGIYGGIAGGALGLYIYTRRAGIPMLPWSDLAAVGLALGQAIGRWGNFFNQELYGRPTEVPWAVQIDPNYRLPTYAEFSTFHPAFLYESIWSLLAFVLLYRLAKHANDRLLPGELTALYLILYAIGRTLLEMTRLDSRTVVLGGVDTQLAVATLVSIVVAVVAGGLVFVRRWRQPAAEAPTSSPHS
jgi:phosphatidylglycerol:prolipoprotein diacylglycerol transferase